MPIKALIGRNKAHRVRTKAGSVAPGARRRCNLSPGDDCDSPTPGRRELAGAESARCRAWAVFCSTSTATPTAKFTSDTKTKHTDAFPTPHNTPKEFTTNTKHQNQLFVLIGALTAV